MKEKKIKTELAELTESHRQFTKNDQYRLVPVAALRRLVEYLWDDEEHDFRQLESEAQADHIFTSLRQVRCWLNQQAASRNEHEHFGHCPYCGGNDGYFNLHRAHYFYCELCRTKWLSGENLFSSWRRETQADWELNQQLFADWEEVQPVYDWCGKPDPIQFENFGTKKIISPKCQETRPRCVPTQQKRITILVVLLIFTTLLFLPELLLFMGLLPECLHCGQSGGYEGR